MNNSEEETKEEEENKGEKEEQWKDTNESQVEDDVSVADSVETKQDNNSPWIDQWDIEIHKVQRPKESSYIVKHKFPQTSKET